MIIDEETEQELFCVVDELDTFTRDLVEIADEIRTRMRKIQIALEF
jgi:hypothetical protein